MYGMSIGDLLRGWEKDLPLQDTAPAHPPLLQLQDVG